MTCESVKSSDHYYIKFPLVWVLHHPVQLGPGLSWQESCSPWTLNSRS